MAFEFTSSPSVVIVIATILTVFLWHFVVRPTFSPLRCIPLARTDWQWTLFKWLWTEPTPPQLLEWANKTPNQGLMRYYGIGGTTRILLTSPEAVKEVMVTKRYDAYQRPASLNQTIELLFGHGLLTSEGDAHRKQKRALAPAFTPRVISGLSPVFWSKACELVKCIGSEIEENSSGKDFADVELREWTSRASLDVIGVAVWGRDFNALAEPHSDFVTKYERIFRPATANSQQQAKWIYAASLLLPMGFLSRQFPCEFFREKAAGGRAVRQTCNAAVEARRASLREGQTSSDVLARMMELDAFDDKALQGQMMNFLSAGHGTTSLTITWLCYFLAQNPAVANRLREEIRSAVPSPRHKDGPAVTNETFTSLSYLHDTIRETLRVMPIIPLLRREASKQTSVLGQGIPAGTDVVCAPWVSNMTKEAWGEDAGSFDPDRWSRAREEGSQRAVPASSAYSYIPFACGPRACIGESFAKAEMAAFVAALVGTYEFDLTSDHKPPEIIWGISAAPVELRLRMRRVEGW